MFSVTSKFYCEINRNERQTDFSRVFNINTCFTRLSLFHKNRKARQFEIILIKTRKALFAPLCLLSNGFVLFFLGMMPHALRKTCVRTIRWVCWQVWKCFSFSFSRYQTRKISFIVYIFTPPHDDLNALASKSDIWKKNRRGNILVINSLSDTLGFVSVLCRCSRHLFVRSQKVSPCFSQLNFIAVSTELLFQCWLPEPAQVGDKCSDINITASRSKHWFAIPLDGKENSTQHSKGLEESFSYKHWKK